MSGIWFIRHVILGKGFNLTEFQVLHEKENMFVQWDILKMPSISFLSPYST